MPIVKTDTRHYTNIADAIRNKANTETQYKPGEMPDGVNEVYNKGFEEGKNSAVDLSRFATLINFENLNLFGTEEIVLNLDNAKSLSSFYTSRSETENKTVKHITVNCPNQISSLQWAFSGNSYPEYFLEHITLNVDTSKCQNWTMAFQRLNAIRIIDGLPLNPISCNTNGFSNTFQSTSNLEEIRFVENSIIKTVNFSACSKLSNDSVQSIINGLADLTGNTAQTLDFNDGVVLKLTDEQILQITNKNWSVT